MVVWALIEIVEQQGDILSEGGFVGGSAAST